MTRKRKPNGQFTSDHAQDVAAMRDASRHDAWGYAFRWPYCTHDFAARRRRAKAVIGLESADWLRVMGYAELAPEDARADNGEDRTDWPLDLPCP